MKKDEDFSALALGLKSIKRARCAAHSIYCNKRARRLINIHTRRAGVVIACSSHPTAAAQKNHKERRSLGNTQRETETESFDCREPLTFHQQASKMVSTRSLSLSFGLTPALLLCEGNVSRGAVSAKKKTATFAAC
jgi:hypothetical protein